MAYVSFPEGDSNLRLNQRRAVVLRWWLLAAVTLAVLSASTLLDLALPQIPMFAVIALMAAFNSYIQWRAINDDRVSASELFFQLCVDLSALAVLLYLSGGAANPLISFLLVPVAVAALSLPGFQAAAVALLAIALYSLLMWAHLPLRLADVERATRLHLAGMWLTFVVSATMIAWFVARMTSSIRERDSRLAAAREQALRDERMVALGTLAAGAAHELGTPLATIAVLIGELAQDVRVDAAARDDLAIAGEQIALCKNIISGMVARAGSLRPEQIQVQDSVRWLERVRTRWQAMRSGAASRLIVEGGGGAPQVMTEPALEQALTNVLNNAVDASHAEIEIRLGWDENKLRIMIRDSGPGFPGQVLRQAGQESLPPRNGGAGIGLLLAFAAVERLGGRLVLDNPSDGGGRVSIELPVVRQAEKMKGNAQTP